MIIIRCFEYSFQSGFWLLLKNTSGSWMCTWSGQCLLSLFLCSAVQAPPGERGVALRGQGRPWVAALSAPCYCSVAKLCTTLRPSGLKHARLPCPSLSLRVCSNSCLLSRRCCTTISSSVAPFSSCLQSFPASESFLMSQLFAQVAKVLELQLQNQCFQWIFRVDLL